MKAGKSHWSDRVRNVPRNLADLQHRLRKHVMVRRLKEQVLHELPRKQWNMFPLEATADVRRALRHEGWEVPDTKRQAGFDQLIYLSSPVALAKQHFS